MGTCHHHLIANLRVGSFDLSDHVVSILVLFEKFTLKVDREFYGNPGGEQPGDHVVMLGSENDGRHGIRSSVVTGDEYGAVFAEIRFQSDFRSLLLDESIDVLNTLALRLLLSRS